VSRGHEIIECHPHKHDIPHPDRNRAYEKDSYILEVTLRNNSSADYVLQNKTNLTYHGHGDLVTIGPHAMTILEVKTLELLTSITLKFSVMNALVAPSTHPDLDFEVSMQLQ
jgi:hypothetical protein